MKHEASRSVPRYAWAIQVQLVDPQSKRKITGQTRDLSLFGCSVAASERFQRGTRVNLAFFHRGACVKGFARVVYATPELGMGLAFSDIEHGQERILEGWIAELAAIPVI